MDNDTTSQKPFAADTLERIAEDIWTALELDPLAPREGEAPLESYYAAVRIDGDDRAEVLVRVSARLAHVLAETMFGEEGDQEMRCDAVGEVANQVAGGVKGLLTGECALHVPQTGVGDAPTPSRQPDATGRWASAQGRLTVSVWRDSSQEVPA